MAGGEHAIGIAVAAIAGEPYRLLDLAEGLAVRAIHQPRTGGEQDRFRQALTRAHAQIALAGRAAVARRTTVAAEALASERLIHDAKDRLAETRQCDQCAPRRHAADERLGAVDGVQHPNVFGIGTLLAEFLADNAVVRKRLINEGAH